MVYNVTGICYLMEMFGNDFRKVNLDNVLGPVTQSNILKNKAFLLTCTIPLKTTNGTNERQVCITYLKSLFWFWIKNIKKKYVWFVLTKLRFLSLSL